MVNPIHWVHPRTQEQLPPEYDYIFRGEYENTFIRHYYLKGS